MSVVCLVEGQLTIVISSLGRTVAALGIVGLLNVLIMIHAAQQRGEKDEWPV